MKQTILFTCILFANVAFAQNLNPDFSDYFGKVHFEMGKTPEIPSDKLTIRIDSCLYRFYSMPELHFNMQTSLNPYERNLSIDLLAPGSTDAPNTRSHRTDLSVFHIDTSYRNKTMTGNRLFALGNVKLPALQAHKVEWLDMDISNGRIIELSNFRKLRGINLCKASISSDWRVDKYQYLSDLSPSNQQGDPFFWGDLQACPKLEVLLLNSNYDELLFVDEELGPLLETHQIKSLYLEGMPYLPVHFRHFESLEFVSIWPVYLPEAVNLAIVMNSFEKDTSAGKWSQFLTVTKEKSVTIPENGAFTTHYINNLLLCSGAFKNGQPDGKWEFYYDDGQLCEQRFYDLGKKTGNWLFFLPDGDTASVFQYKNEKLVYREDRLKGYDNPCDNYEFSYDVMRKTSYSMYWKNDHEVSILKKQSSVVPPDNWDDRSPKGDTLSDTREYWKFSAREWEYTRTDVCKGNQNTYEQYNKGRLGENAYYGKKTDKNPTTTGKYPNEHRCMSVREMIVDFPNNIHEEIQYNDDNPEKIMQVINAWQGPLLK